MVDITLEMRNGQRRYPCIRWSPAKTAGRRTSRIFAASNAESSGWAAAFCCPHFWTGDAASAMTLKVKQFEWLVAGLPWQRLSICAPRPISVV